MCGGLSYPQAGLAETAWKAGESGNMLTWRFAFVPPCGVAVPFNLERVNNCFFGKQPTVAGLERIGGLIMEKR